MSGGDLSHTFPVELPGRGDTRSLSEWLIDIVDSIGMNTTSDGRVRRTVLNAPIEKLPNWRKAVAKVRRGTANARLLCVGDSTTAGYLGSVSTSNGLGAYPVQLASQLTARGLTANSHNFIGNKNWPSGGLGGNDSRLTTSGSISQTIKSAGGYLMNWTAAGGLTFTPTASVDTFDVWYVQNAAGSFTINLDGGANTTVNTAGTTNLLKATITGSLGAHTLNLAWVSGTIFILGVEAYNSAAKEVSVLNSGAYGWIASDWNPGSVTSKWQSANAISAISPDLTIICLTINDANTPTSESTYKTNLQIIIDAAKVTGDVILMTGVPTSRAAQPNIERYMRELAVLNDVPLIDLSARWSNYTTSNALGFYADTTHPNALGQSDVAAAIAAVVAL